jgi:hypothetical protein
MIDSQTAAALTAQLRVLEAIVAGQPAGLALADAKAALAAGTQPQADDAGGAA